MHELPQWLDPISRLEDFDGDVMAYLFHLHGLFERDFVISQTKFRGKVVLFDSALEEGRSREFTILLLRKIMRHERESCLCDDVNV